MSQNPYKIKAFFENYNYSAFIMPIHSLEKSKRGAKIKLERENVYSFSKN